MKKLLVVFIGLSLVLSCTDPDEALVVGERTTSEFSKESHDFGDATEGDVLTTVFEVKNTGEIPLRLINVKPSCGCTTPNWTKEPIMPGQKGEIEVNVNTAGMQGNLTKNVTVISNSEPIKQRLEVKANLKAK